jgi:hypothetical protein
MNWYQRKLASPQQVNKPYYRVVSPMYGAGASANGLDAVGPGTYWTPRWDAVVRMIRSMFYQYRQNFHRDPPKDWVAKIYQIDSAIMDDSPAEHQWAHNPSTDAGEKVLVKALAEPQLIEEVSPDSPRMEYFLTQKTEKYIDHSRRNQKFKWNGKECYLSPNYNNKTFEVYEKGNDGYSFNLLAVFHSMKELEPFLQSAQELPSREQDAWMGTSYAITDFGWHDYNTASNWYHKAKFAANSNQGDTRDIWKMPMEQYAPHPFTPEEQKLTEWTDDMMERRRGYRRQQDAWTHSMSRAISQGLITPEEAEQRGFKPANVSKINWQPLPSPLYHVTTHRTAAVQQGLKSRYELQQSSGKGLGGGDEYTISFTDSYEIAQGIYRAIREGREVAALSKGPMQLLIEADKGEGAQRPFLNDIFKQYTSSSDQGQYSLQNLPDPLKWLVSGMRVSRAYFPETAEEWAAKNGEGWKPFGERWPHGEEERYTQFARKMSKDEFREECFRLFKAFLFFREQAGGHLDPLFFTADEKGLGATPPDEIAILVCQPRKGAVGYKVNALGEWRTFAGEAIDIVDVIQ